MAVWADGINYRYLFILPKCEHYLMRQRRANPLYSPLGRVLGRDRDLLVNPFMQTKASSVLAAGDVARVYDRWTGKHNLDVLWPSLINDRRAAASRPLRNLFENEVDLAPYQDQLLANDTDLPGNILRAWRDRHQCWQ